MKLFSLELFSLELIPWDAYDPPDPELAFMLSLLSENVNDSYLEFFD